MGPRMLAVSAIIQAVVAIGVLLVGDWWWAWPFIVSSFVLSALSHRERKRLAVIVAEERAWLPSFRHEIERGRRAFEPYTTCRGCGMSTYHVFSPVREVHDTYCTADEEVSFSVWNKAGVYRVRECTCEVCVPGPPTMVIDRECLSCGKTWEEKAS